MPLESLTEEILESVSDPCRGIIAVNPLKCLLTTCDRDAAPKQFDADSCKGLRYRGVFQPRIQPCYPWFRERPPFPFELHSIPRMLVVK